ncbi:MAG: hypothetical protein EAY81_09105 [Bacteroidetes bacterium]|nr:MAG: hypothetical protein EAY81_09105 [Bacteroidota bacterium]
MLSTAINNDVTCFCIRFFSNFAFVELPNKNLQQIEADRLKLHLAKTPTERFRLMIHLFKLQQQLKKANPPK